MVSKFGGIVVVICVRRKYLLYKEISEKAYQIAFADGSVTTKKFGRTISGIGGLIKNSMGNLLYIFSGPSSTISVLDTELAAINHILWVIQEKPRQFWNVTICSDSRKVTAQSKSSWADFLK